MIIRSVRLKNIKSYGAGESDQGVTVAFESGVNRIAGRNGHGKSTLIEAIGYALFLARPDYAENFKVETYLLRDGAKEGEIDVSFEHRGSAHRVERGLGKSSKRRTKVVDLADESICAEGDKEVEAFICELLEVPSAKSLTEVFAKLVGVKQGRLTRPFDSKGAEARNFFEPLFDVAIFKECRDKLKPARDQFDDRLRKAELRKAAVDQIIEERADCKDKLAEAEETIQRQQGQMKAAVKARDEAKAKWEKHEKLQDARNQAEKRRDRASGEMDLAAAKSAAAKERRSESESAVATAQKTLPAHENHEDARRQLVKLEERREERDALNGRRDKAENQRKERAAGADGARNQSRDLAGRQKKKSAELEGKDRELAALDAKLSNSALEFEKEEKAFADADDRMSILRAWVSGLPGAAGRVRDGAREIARLNKDLAAWKPEALKAAQEAHDKADQELKLANKKRTEARERQATLKAQLDQISGGVCPFLKESCKQFDPAKVQSDLSTLEREIADGEKLADDCGKALEKAAKSLGELQTAKAQLAPKQETLDSESRGALKELESLASGNVLDAAGKLQAWDGRIQPPPGLPSVPDVIKPEGVVELAEAVAEFSDQAEDWRGRLERVFEEREEAWEQVRKNRTLDEQSLKQLKERKEELGAEAKSLSRDAEAKLNEAKKLDAQADEARSQVEELDRQLKAFEGLDGHLAKQRERQKVNREGHEKHLRAKELADDLENRQKAAAEAQSKRDEAHGVLKTAEQKFVEADKAFDLAALSEAAKDHQDKSNAVAAMEEKLAHAKEAKAEEEKRYNEWKKAGEELAEVEAEMRRLEASIEITDLARKVLQNAAPRVAQHLCDRIAGRAQIVFNRINPDPIDLSWEAHQYSVRIVPGDRRFAMLSGGEQTKLALALTLAMIEEFGGLRFCIFDEPTYGVDADSRQKLADAIIEAQSAANLEQLLLVSHDDAFEGKIEHGILLGKSAQFGSTLSLDS